MKGETAKTALLWVGAIAVVVVVLWLPLGLIWSVNTLFRAGIEWTADSYFAALFLLIVTGARWSRGEAKS